MTLPANLADMVTALDRAAEFSGKAPEAYIKLSQKTQLWSVGTYEEQLSPKSLFVLDPTSVIAGYSAFKDRARVGEVMRPLNEGEVDESELDDVGAEWKKQMGMKIYCLEGPDEGVAGLMAMRSTSGLRAIRDLLTKVAGQIKREQPFIPAFHLSSKPFEASYGGTTIYAPVFKLVEWLDESALRRAIDLNANTAHRGVIMNNVIESTAENVEVLRDEPEQVPVPKRRRRQQ